MEPPLFSGSASDVSLQDFATFPPAHFSSDSHMRIEIELMYLVRRATKLVVLWEGLSKIEEPGSRG
jgi:hypothetical protein